MLFSLRWQLIKMLFTKKLKERMHDKESVWQGRFWEHEIKSGDDLRAHIHYCYLNPVKHGYVLSTRDWAVFKFHRDVKLGLFDIHLEWFVRATMSGINIRQITSRASANLT